VPFGSSPTTATCPAPTHAGLENDDRSTEYEDGPAIERDLHNSIVAALAAAESNQAALDSARTTIPSEAAPNHDDVAIAGDDRDDNGPIPTALNTLIHQGALYVGHPTVVRSPPKLSPMRRDQFVGGGAPPSDLGGETYDYGAKDFWVSRVGEKHPHQDLHGLLPPTKPLDDGDADAPSLQDAFRRHRQGFISNSKARTEAVAQARATVAAASSHPRQVPQVRESRDGGATQVTSHDSHAAQAQASLVSANVVTPDYLRDQSGRMRKSEISTLNKRLYTRLCPEVRKAKEAQKKADEYAKNRAKAKAYGQKLRQRLNSHTGEPF
jgi:hypothetical protein